jgi:hypothetical protein
MLHSMQNKNALNIKKIKKKDKFFRGTNLNSNVIDLVSHVILAVLALNMQLHYCIVLYANLKCKEAKVVSLHI